MERKHAISVGPGEGTWAKPTGELWSVDHTPDCHNQEQGSWCIDTPCTYQSSLRAVANGHTFSDNSSSEYTGRTVFSQWLQEIRTMVFHSMGKETEAQDGPINFPRPYNQECWSQNVTLETLESVFLPTASDNALLSHTQKGRAIAAVPEDICRITGL